LKTDVDFAMLGDHFRGPGDSSFDSAGPRKDLS